MASIITFKISTAGPNEDKLSTSVSNSLAIAAKTITTNSNEAILLPIFSILSAELFKKCLTIIPETTGTVVSRNIVSPRLSIPMFGASDPMK